MDLKIISNEIKLTTLGLVDAVDGKEVTGSFANTLFASSDTSAFVVDQTGKITPVNLEGATGDLIIETDATYTDSTGTVKTEHKSLTVNVTIVKLVTADAVNLVATFTNA